MEAFPDYFKPGGFLERRDKIRQDQINEQAADIRRYIVDQVECALVQGRTSVVDVVLPVTPPTEICLEAHRIILDELNARIPGLVGRFERDIWVPLSRDNYTFDKRRLCILSYDPLSFSSRQDLAADRLYNTLRLALEEHPLPSSSD